MSEYEKRKEEKRCDYELRINRLKEEIILLEKNLQEEITKIDNQKNGNEKIKFKGYSLIDIFYNLSKNSNNQTSFKNFDNISNEWYNKIKYLYPSYDNSKDIVEGREEHFYDPNPYYYTFFINNTPFYQLRKEYNILQYYISENIGKKIITSYEQERQIVINSESYYKEFQDRNRRERQKYAGFPSSSVDRRK